MDGVNPRKKVILSIAPVGQSEESFAASPKSAEAVAAEVVDSARNGAGMAHLHPRDAAGMPTSDLSVFSRTLDLIRAETDMVVQASTGGLSTLSLDERCIAVTEPRVESASLNIGSINFGDTVYINTLPDARYWAKRIMDASVKAELEIFDLGMLNAAASLIGDGLAPPPPHFAIALGFEWGLPPDPKVLEFVVSRLPDDALWGVIHHGMKNLDLLLQAVRMGACFVRVGYEDSMLGPDGRAGMSNAALAAAAAEAIVRGGREPATPDEARLILGLKGK